jgi:DeoR/GlpR family transcriptional regulator of sugar metabolism
VKIEKRELRMPDKLFIVPLMLPLERHRRLLGLLSEQSSIRTAELARSLGVTQETVRRDFEKLEKDGALLRTHGGAVKLESARREYSVNERSEQQAAEKKAIAQAALKLIQDGQTIFLDPSTTAQALAAILPDRPLTVITNSIQIPTLLVERPEIRVVLLGGSFRASSLSCTGMVADLAADLFRIDAAFMSCRGIDARQGLSEATEDHARLKRHLISRAKAFYLLADSSKVGVASSYFFATNDAIDIWITDTAPSPEFRANLEPQGLQIQVVAAE